LEKKQKPKKTVQAKPHKSVELEKGVVSADLVMLVKKPPKPKENLRRILKDERESLHRKQ
jgi:hypothetical protein